MSTKELERRLIYSVIVAGKSARFTEAALTRLLDPHSHPLKWLRFLDQTDRLEEALRAARTGNYTKMARAIRELIAAQFDLRTVQPEQLETIHGIGPKTARFFVIWTRPGEQFAALDVHVLRWMRANGYPDAPKATPTGERYRRLELAFIAEAHKRGMTPGELDAAIWDAGSKGKAYQDKVGARVT